MKNSLFLSAILLFALAFSCSSPRTYEQAAKEFRSSLTFQDTLNVLLQGQNFMDALVAGDFEQELSELCVVKHDTLYKISDRSYAELASRFSNVKPTDYALESYCFSTPGLNDLTFRYVLDGKVGTGPGFKLVFNPVKVGDAWFLTLKDGVSSRMASDPVLEGSLAPNPIVLNE